MERMPTPFIGTMVWWFDRNRQESPRAALVTAVEAPGKLKLTIMGPNAMPIYKAGVLHVSHSIHANPANATTVHSGSWDYIGHAKPPKEDWAACDRRIEDLEESRREQERIYAQAAENKRAREAAKATA